MKSHRCAVSPQSRSLPWPDLKPCGWGRAGENYDAIKSKRFLDALCRRGLSAGELVLPAQWQDFDLPQSRLPKNFVTAWQAKGLSVRPEDRILHAAGRSYRDLIRLRQARLERYPDGVLHLNSAMDIENLFRDAARSKITLIPFGGGTGVVGGTECVGANERPILVVDMKRLSRLIEFDAYSRTARFEAGILGPDLEHILHAHGATLGHFPQSFEFSTLGGWVATRSAGQNSTRYGKIENRVRGLTLHSPKGVIRVPAMPASAVGPSLRELLIGSEGVYGLITDVSVVVAPAPEAFRMAVVMLPGLPEGLACLHELSQTGARPSIVRLHDAEESSLFLDLSVASLFERGVLAAFKTLSQFDEKATLLFIGCEGTREESVVELKHCLNVVKRHGGRSLKKSYESSWGRDRFRLPYLRDDLLDHGYFIDTLETATSWTKLAAVRDALKTAFANSSDSLWIGSHVSHVYPDGASLYFTFIGRQRRGYEIPQWDAIKKRATDAILNAGGTLSHHHGIGYDHKNWLKREETAVGVSALRAIKYELDPDNLINPGKIFTEDK